MSQWRHPWTFSIHSHVLQGPLKTTWKNTLPVLSACPREPLPLIFWSFQGLPETTLYYNHILRNLPTLLNLTRAQWVRTQHYSSLCFPQDVAQRLVGRYKGTLWLLEAPMETGSPFSWSFLRSWLSCAHSSALGWVTVKWVSFFIVVVHFS